MSDSLDNFMDDMERQQDNAEYEAICPKHGVRGTMVKGGHAVCDWPCGYRLILGEQVN